MRKKLTDNNAMIIMLILLVLASIGILTDTVICFIEPVRGVALEPFVPTTPLRNIGGTVGIISTLVFVVTTLWMHIRFL